MFLFSTVSPAVERIARRILAATLLLMLASPVYVGWTRASGDDADQKVKKQFYSAKDRLAVMKVSALYEPKVVADANILEGPKQGKKSFNFTRATK